MTTEFIERENEIFAVMQAVNAAELDYVVIGGYAVSAFQHRFSVDVDLVIREADLNGFAVVLEDRGFTKAMDKDLEVYGGRFVAYEKDAELPVSIDLLVNGVTSRQTDATWGYDYIQEHAAQREIEGSEQAVTAPVPDPAVLIAIKLHSGRLTDVRDVVALAAHTDLAAVEAHLCRGDDDHLREVLEDALATLEDDNFADAFKGVFVQEETPENTIDRVRAFLQAQIETRERDG